MPGTDMHVVRPRQPSGPAASPAVVVDARADVVRAGVRVTVALALAGMLYALVSWDEPHRPLLVALCAVAVLDAFLMAGVLGPALLRRAHAVRVLAGWNVLHTIAITAAASLDGGIGSPFVAMLPVSVVYAAFVLPTTAVIVVVALFAVAALDGAADPTLILSGSALVVTASLCCSLARVGARRVAALDAARHDTLRILGRAVDFRDNETGGHIERIGEYCRIVGRQLRLPAAELDLLRQAAP